MTLHRFFVAPGDMAGEQFPLPRAISHQVTRVLRLRDDDHLVLLDGEGQAATVRLRHGECVVESRRPAGGEPRHQLSVWQALLRGDHLEPVIRHGTEIGVAEFRLMVTERCVRRDLSPRKLQRLRDGGIETIYDPTAVGLGRDARSRRRCDQTKVTTARTKSRTET